MGKAGKLKKKAAAERKEAAAKRLEVLKKKIKAIAEEEVQIKKSGPIGHLGMDEILTKIKTQIKAPKSSNPLAAVQSKSGALENVRDLIETYKKIDAMISSFNDERPDNDQTDQEMKKIESWLDSIERQTGIAKEQPGQTQDEIIKRNILARIDRGLKQEVEALERAIASSPDEFENPTVNLRAAIERAKNKILHNQTLVAQKKEDKKDENDDEKEHAILKWEIEINKIEKQINLISTKAKTEPSDSELNQYIAECRIKLEKAKGILADVKGNPKPHLAENDRVRINQTLIDLNAEKIKQTARRTIEAGANTPTPSVEQHDRDEEEEFDKHFGVPTDTKRNSDDLDDLLSEIFPDSTPHRTSEEQRQEFLDNVGQLAAKKGFNAISFLEFPLFHNYENEIPKIFTEQYEPLGRKLFAFFEEIKAIRSTSLDDNIPKKLEAAYEEILAVLPEEFKNRLPARLGEQPQNLTKPTSTQLSNTSPITEQTLSKDQKEWLKLFAEAAKSINEHPTFVTYDFIPAPDTCKDAFTGDIANIGILAQAFYDACDKVPTLATNPEFQTKLEEAKKAYNLLIDALPQSLQSAFELPKKFEASTPSVTSKTSSTVKTETKVKSPFITLDGSNKLLFEKLKVELKKSNPNISVIDKLIDDLKTNQFAKGHELEGKLTDLQLEFLALDLDETPISSGIFKELSKYIESLPIIEDTPTHDAPFNTNNIQIAIELQTLLSSENTITDRMRTLAQSLLDDDSFIQKNGAEHPLHVKLNALIHADATTEKKQIEETSDLLTQWVQKPQTAKIITDTTRTQEIEQLRTIIDGMHQKASSLLEEPNRRLANIHTLLSEDPEGLQETTLDRINLCKIQLESLRTRLVEIGKMEDFTAKGNAYDELMKNTAELSGQIVSIEADVKSVIKKTNKVDTDEADLREHPSAKIADPDAQITIGDMHGNTMKLIHFLIRQGVMELASPEEYKSLRLIYEVFNDDNAYRPENKDNLKSQLVIFNDIINRAKIIDPAPTIRLIGDELADRGANDYLTLKVLEKLSKSGTNVEILMSNHSMEFLGPIEKGSEAGKDGVTEFNDLGGQQGQSGVNLYRLLDLGVINFAEVQELVDNHYKKFTRALSYTLSEDKKEITIFSHAAIGMKQLVEIAEALGIHNVESPQSAVEIAKLIDVIIDEMMKRVLNNTLHEFTYRAEDNPIGFLFWNRNYNPDILDRRPELANGDKCNWAHGHDSTDPLKDKPHIKMLDSLFGKFWDDQFMKTSDKMKNPVLTTYGTSPRLALAMTQEQHARQEPERVTSLERARTDANADKQGARTAIESTENLGDLLAFIEVTNNAFAGLGNEDCRAAIRKLGHETELDVDELKEFLEVARKRALQIATKQALSIVSESQDKDNVMKLLLCDPCDFTNNSFKDTLTRIVKDENIVETLVSNKDTFDISVLLDTARNNIRDEILQKAESIISGKPKDDPEIIKLNDANNAIDTDNTLKALLGDQLYKELIAVKSTDDQLNRLIEAARFVAEENKDVRKAITELTTKIIEIEDISQLKNLATLLQENADLDNPDCRTAFANLFKVNSTDSEDPRIQVIVDAEANLESWFGEAIEQVHEKLVRQTVIEVIKKTDGKSSDYADLLGEFIDASGDEIEERLKAIVGDDLIEHLKLTNIDLNDFVDIAKKTLAPIALDKAMTNLEASTGNANEYSIFIVALKKETDDRTKEENELIDKLLSDTTENLRWNLISSECDLSPIIQLAQQKLAGLSIEAAKKSISSISVSTPLFNPNALIDFIKSAKNAPPSVDRFDKLKAVITPSEIVDHLITANVTDLSKILESAQGKLQEVTLNKLLTQLKGASEAKLIALISEAPNLHGITHPALQKAINDIAGIPNYHKQIQLLSPAGIRQLITTIAQAAVFTRTAAATDIMLNHVKTISDIAILTKLSNIDINQDIDNTQISTLTNIFGSKVNDFLPALIEANPTVKMSLLVTSAKQRIAILKTDELKQNIALFQGSRDAMMQLHKETNLTAKIDLLVQNGIITSTFASQLKDAALDEFINIINDTAKQWVIDNLIKSAKTIIDDIKEIDKLPVINTLADLDQFDFSPQEKMYLSDTTDLARVKLVIEQRKEAIELATSTPSDNIAQIRDVREFIANRATISDLEALQTAVNAKDEAQCKVVLKRRGFSDESLSELKTADFDKLNSLIDTQLSEMKLQETAAKSAKYNLDHCDTELELAIRQQDAIQRDYDTQFAIIDDENADEDALNDVNAELEVLKPQLEEAKSKVAIARSDLNHARERFERADTIVKDKQNKLHQSELRHLEARSKQVEAKQKERERLIQSVTEANTGVTQATTAETEAKRLLELAKVPKRPTESDEEFSARQSTIPDLTTKHAEKERQLAEAKRIKTEADLALSTARAIKSDIALQEELTAANQAVVAHKNRQPPQVSDEPRQQIKQQLHEDETINQNATRTDLDVRRREVDESLKKALKRESKLIARKAELDSLLASNPSQSIKQAAQTELTQLNQALESVRKQINANEALIAGTIPTATKDARKKLEVEAKLTEDEANTCMRDYKQANKFTNDKISIADHIRTNIMTKPQTLTTLEKLADNYVVQLEYLAKRGHDENAKDELSTLLDKSAKLHAQLEIYKDELNKEILHATADKEKHLATLQKVNAILMALKKAQQAYHQPLAEVGSLCIISSPPTCSTEDEINDQIANILGSSSSSSTGYLGTSVAKINTTATFTEAAGRVTKMELEDGRALRKGTFNAAVVQKTTPSGGFVTIFHVNDSDKARITGNTSLTAGAKLIEEHRLGNHHSSDPIDICGKFPPQMVKDMIMYCEAKGYKYNNLTDTKFTPSAKKVSDLQEKLDTDKVKTAIFGTAKELGTSKAKITALEKEIKLDETPVPTSTRPST